MVVGDLLVRQNLLVHVPQLDWEDYSTNNRAIYFKRSKNERETIQFVPDTNCSRYNLCPIQFVPDIICSRYNWCPIQFVPIQFVPMQIVPIQFVPIQFVHEPFELPRGMQVSRIFP